MLYLETKSLVLQKPLHYLAVDELAVLAIVHALPANLVVQSLNTGNQALCAILYIL